MLLRELHDRTDLPLQDQDDRPAQGEHVPDADENSLGPTEPPLLLRTRSNRLDRDVDDDVRGAVVAIARDTARTLVVRVSQICDADEGHQGPNASEQPEEEAGHDTPHDHRGREDHPGTDPGEQLALAELCVAEPADGLGVQLVVVLQAEQEGHQRRERDQQDGGDQDNRERQEDEARLDGVRLLAEPLRVPRVGPQIEQHEHLSGDPAPQNDVGEHGDRDQDTERDPQVHGGGCEDSTDDCHGQEDAQRLDQPPEQDLAEHHSPVVAVAVLCGELAVLAAPLDVDPVVRTQRRRVPVAAPFGTSGPYRRDFPSQSRHTAHFLSEVLWIVERARIGTGTIIKLTCMYSNYSPWSVALHRF